MLFRYLGEYLRRIFLGVGSVVAWAGGIASLVVLLGFSPASEGVLTDVGVRTGLVLVMLVSAIYLVLGIPFRMWARNQARLDELERQQASRFTASGPEIHVHGQARVSVYTGSDAAPARVEIMGNEIVRSRGILGDSSWLIRLVKWIFRDRRSA